MENMQNNMPENKKTGLITIIAGVVVLGILVWWMMMTSKSPESIGTSPTPVVDQNADINKDLNNINLQTPDFNSIDENIKGL